MKTVKELRELAQELNIPGRSKMNKQELIEAIDRVSIEVEDYIQAEQPEGEVKKEFASAEWDGNDEPVTICPDAKIKKTVSINGRECDVLMSVPAVKERYLEQAQLGHFVAFQSGRRVCSAKIINKDSRGRRLKVVNRLGLELVISYSAVLWVKESGKWPDAIYALLKGGVYGGTVNTKSY